MDTLDTVPHNTPKGAYLLPDSERKQMMSSLIVRFVDFSYNNKGNTSGTDLVFQGSVALLEIPAPNFLQCKLYQLL